VESDEKKELEPDLLEEDDELELDKESSEAG
jgi:hypothetical protein